MENVKVNKVQGSHMVHIDERQRVTLTGVTQVDTFNEDNVVLHTTMGVLNIKGKAMKVNKLNVDNGDMSIEGEIISLTYTSKDTSNKENLIKRLFK
jgi:sporulation protein YabP